MPTWREQVARNPGIVRVAGTGRCIHRYMGVGDAVHGRSRARRCAGVTVS